MSLSDQKLLAVKHGELPSMNHLRHLLLHLPGPHSPWLQLGQLETPIGRPGSRPEPEVEEKRLEKLGVIAPLEKKIDGYKNLATRFVRDWRAKQRSNEPGAPKQFLRRSRLVAREYATDRRDDVHSPATGGQALRILPAIYLMKRQEEERGGLQYTLGALDINSGEYSQWAL